MVLLIAGVIVTHDAMLLEIAAHRFQDVGRII